MCIFHQESALSECQKNHFNLIKIARQIKVDKLGDYLQSYSVVFNHFKYIKAVSKFPKDFTLLGQIQ